MVPPMTYTHIYASHRATYLEDFSPRGRAQENLDEVETVLIRKFPYPWQVRAPFARLCDCSQT
jgi:hypothetical protein